ncbi:electron transfer flavoprotein subunit alpha [Pectinatus cerevisiiphilus]|uniref:Electron transfer flavoprotein alpha subunit apoprotein n=1 Tax=Pectinatus cerevisiiphilus TaxID=86956 RepID=A0A4R3K6H7_9FIRM|nr:electron transfer flavoprotein subunit alpha [Pectinatus cerevisiiphilus]TCS78429.1 electron transfer flavoprotein alpha subunit apoprotein [Pectinatus cerevisiiphilus]
MAKLVIHQEKITDAKALAAICPFGAIQEKDGKISISAACRMCRMCVRKGPKGAIEYVEGQKKAQIDKTKWRGITVYVDHVDGVIHPVTYELLGKAKELAAKIKQPVYALFIGSGITHKAEELLHYGADKVYTCDKPQLEYFKIEAYTSVFAEFIKKIKPAAILVGATPVGRQLAPRVAARFGTGLTADCTILDIKENTDLVQIRPAFGGNIMAEILTPNTRPQMATVRYKIMDAPKWNDTVTGTIEALPISDDKLKSHIEVLGVTKKKKEQTIDGADVIVVAGRGVKKRTDLKMLEELADLLGGQTAATRPLVEAGWMDPKKQIGLSGRTVRPKLIITCGVSGSVQFVAGMNHADTIFAINSDPKASIFKTANYAVKADLYDVIPKLIEKIKTGGKVL